MALSQHSRRGRDLFSRDGSKDLTTAPGNANATSRGRLLGGRFALHEVPVVEHPFQALQVDDLVLNFRVSLYIVPEAFGSRFPNSYQVLRTQVGRLRQLLHPLLLNILVEGEEEGMFFFSTEQSAGESLSQVLRRRRRNHQAFSLEEAMGFCGLLSRGLGYLNRSVRHGFLNSLEILLEPWPDGPLPYYPRIALPGIRCAFRHTPMVFQGLDDEASCYVPPEFTLQRPVDQRADVYGMGAVLYSLLTLRPPTGRFIRPSSVRPGLPEEVDRIILRALEEDPNQRYASIEDLAASLREQPEPAIGWDELEEAGKRLVDGFRIRGVVLPASLPEAGGREKEETVDLPSQTRYGKTMPAGLLQGRLKSVCLLFLVLSNLILLFLALWDLSTIKQGRTERLEEYQHWERFFMEKG